MLLRQYFMSLKILGKWKNWSTNLGHHWSRVHEDLHDVHPVREPVGLQATAARLSTSTVSSGEKPKPQGEDVPGVIGQALRNDRRPAAHSGTKDTDFQPGHEQHPGLSDSEDDSTDVPPVRVDPSRKERELMIIRRTVRKWWRLAGLKGHSAMCDEKGENFGVSWTRSICPKVEGRIHIIGVNA